MSGDGYMTLLGTEAVSRAASTMSSAADSISRSVRRFIPPDWSPTWANVNELPAPVRRYIRDLEAAADPAGARRALVLLREENAILSRIVARYATMRREEPSP